MALTTSTPGEKAAAADNLVTPGPSPMTLEKLGMIHVVDMVMVPEGSRMVAVFDHPPLGMAPQGLTEHDWVVPGLMPRASITAPLPVLKRVPARTLASVTQISLP